MHYFVGSDNVDCHLLAVMSISPELEQSGTSDSAKNLRNYKSSARKKTSANQRNLQEGVESISSFVVSGYDFKRNVDR